MKIYTKTGDGGTTSLIGGKRVSKSHPRVEAYGTADELMAHIAHLRDSMTGNIRDEYGEELLTILDKLMSVSSVLASEEELRILEESDVKHLEERIDAMQADLPKIEKFTLPGGHALVSLSHIARTVCRRAERDALRIESGAESHHLAAKYLNRLSDYLYTLGRKLCVELHAEELLWEPCKNK